MFTDEPLSAILVAVATLISAIGGLTIWRNRGKPALSPLELLEKAVSANTSTTIESNQLFAKNLTYFENVDKVLTSQAHDISLIREHTKDTLDVQRRLVEETIRQGRQ